MVENAYKVTLVSSFVPLAFGLFWKPATRQGGLAAILMGLASWLTCEVAFADAAVPPQMVGLMFSISGMVFGSLLPQWINERPGVKEVHIA
jgi:Na+/proline symporter